MLSLDEFLKKGGAKIKIFKGFRLTSPKAMTSKLTICIPDMHLLEKGPTDDFFGGKSANETRFVDFLDFLNALKGSEKDGVEFVQVGDMFDLWQARGNTNLIVQAYRDVIGLLHKLNPTYVVGNHDIDLVRWYKDKNKTFGRKWRHYSMAEGKKRAIYEHGFQADMANNQDSWSGVIGKEITKIVGMMEYIDPDIDVELSAIWESVLSVFKKYGGFSPNGDPRGFSAHELMKYYVELMEKYNGGQTLDHYGPGELDLAIAVIAHTHNARLVQVPRDGKALYLLDCGSWVNGGHEFGVLSGKDMAVCQWG